MDLVVATEGEIKIIRVRKEKLTYDTLESINQQLLNIIEEGNYNLILNLSAVTYIDSYCAGFLMDIYRKLFNKAGHLKLVGLNPRVRNVLTLVRIDKVVDVFDNEEDAVNSFAHS
jgi:anti-sigma B factor antagonist